MGNKGKKAENSLVNAINDHTRNNVIAFPMGYSGNQKGASPDILVLDTSVGGAYGIELKNHNPDKIAKFERGTDKLEDLDQMEILESAGIKMYAAVTWSHAELYMARAGTDAPTALIENTPEKFNPRVSEKTGHFRVDNPREYESRESHPSARSGRPDYKVVLDYLGIPERLSADSDSSEEVAV